MFRKYFIRYKDKLGEKKKYEEIKFDALKESMKYFESTESSVDDITWDDLNMDKVYTKMNYTLTTPGEEYLYNWLRNPLDNDASIEQRKKLLDDVKEYEGQGLEGIGYCDYDFKDVVKNGFKSSFAMLSVFALLALSSVALIVYSAIIKELTLLPVLGALFLVNLLIHYKFSLKYGAQMDILIYTLKILSYSSKNKKTLKKIMPKLVLSVEAFDESFVSVMNKVVSLFKKEGMDLIADYINITFLIKEINFLIVSMKIDRRRQELFNVYDGIGKIDACRSILRYRKDLKYYSEPELISGRNEMSLEDVYHPLIEDFVSNSIVAKESVAITGSNMSGKSTFLRTLGINTLFSQSIMTSLSKSYSGEFCRLITSISLSDNIMNNKSFFLMEAEAIKRMISYKDYDYPSLVLIDEIFKGTNPTERLAASVEILNLLAMSNVKVFVATHDLPILKDLDKYEFYYFKENVTDESLSFDYKIHKGISNTRNAIKILKYVKYPESLLNNINGRISTMEV
jgi:DNA mismatch repair ATPase MutS